MWHHYVCPNISGAMSIFHKRNGIALLVVLVAALTVAILVLLKPSTMSEYILHSVLICILWLIPSSMYYMLILNYKKTMNSDVIPKIVLSLSKTLQSMYTCDKYTPAQADLIGHVAGETVVKAIMTKTPDTSIDVGTVLDVIAQPTLEELTEQEINDTYADEEYMVPAGHKTLTEEKRIDLSKPMIDMKELQQKARTMAEHYVGFVEPVKVPHKDPPSAFKMELDDALKAREAKLAERRRTEEMMKETTPATPAAPPAPASPAPEPARSKSIRVSFDMP